MNHLLVALDFSKFSSIVENVAYTLAKKINATVILVTIVDKAIDYEPVNTGQVFTDIWEESLRMANENLNKVKIAHPDVETSIISFLGDPDQDIIDLAVKYKAQFIVIGTHGRSGLTKLIMGSTAEFVIRHATIPVIVVPYRMGSH